MTNLNKRQLERFPLELPAMLQVSDDPGVEPIEVCTKDVCSGGAFFHTTESIPVGTDVSIDLVIPIGELKKIAADNVLIKVDGSVIRTTDEGMVVRFSSKYHISPVEKR
jgi:hypothetical protein